MSQLGFRPIPCFSSFPKWELPLEDKSYSVFLDEPWEIKTFLVSQLQWWRNSENLRAAFENAKEY